MSDMDTKVYLCEVCSIFCTVYMCFVFFSAHCSRYAGNSLPLTVDSLTSPGGHSLPSVLFDLLKCCVFVSDKNHMERRSNSAMKVLKTPLQISRLEEEQRITERPTPAWISAEKKITTVLSRTILYLHFNPLAQ